MINIIPSLFNANILSIKEDIDLMEKNQIQYLHIDIMDGNYVPNIAFGPDQIKAISNYTSLKIDLHLMVQNPQKLLPYLLSLPIYMISIHYETTSHHNELLKLIKKNGIKAGIALNPSTSPDVLKYSLDNLDYVLLMSVNPGHWKQEFIPTTYEKIKHTKKIIDNTDITIEIDGKMNPHRIKKASSIGANSFVVGSYLFENNLKTTLPELLKI